MKVQSQGGNKYTFDFGGGAETIVADGTDQPGLQGTLLSAKQEAPDTWIVQRKKAGQLMLRATWKLSADGSTLTLLRAGPFADRAAATAAIAKVRAAGLTSGSNSGAAQ